MRSTSDYALKIIFYLSVQNDYITYHELAAVLRIPSIYVIHIINGLSKANMVVKADTVWGGIRLQKQEQVLTIEVLRKIIALFK